MPNYSVLVRYSTPNTKSRSAYCYHWLESQDLPKAIEEIVKLQVQNPDNKYGVITPFLTDGLTSSTNWRNQHNENKRARIFE